MNGTSSRMEPLAPGCRLTGRSETVIRYAEMTTHSRESWPYPGSRWWKFDFHAHTPASRDATAWQQAIGTESEVTPKRWLLEFMKAGIDCVAVTDHNSGEWIDRLKNAYSEMRGHAKRGKPPDGFRRLTLFPGVEISVNGGFHLLAIFDPAASTASITRVLEVCRIRGRSRKQRCHDYAQRQ